MVEPKNSISSMRRGSPPSPLCLSISRESESPKFTINGYFYFARGNNLGPLTALCIRSHIIQKFEIHVDIRDPKSGLKRNFCHYSGKTAFDRITLNSNDDYGVGELHCFALILLRDILLFDIWNFGMAIIYTGDEGEQVLKTDGVNIVGMFKHSNILEINRIYSNDIHAMAKTYGIEAAVQVIIQEVFNIFKVYGITIDRRHLSLIADYMTFDGTFQPLSRKGMEHSSSPLQQMSFESSMQFLKYAAGAGWSDKLNSPSSRLSVGLPVQNGTGAFHLLTNIL
uniref:DNA-directed RNA polymerase n=1 Tax=Glossina austeni TaxID=7395 RepID=A0A1A9URF5_GLOAU